MREEQPARADGPAFFGPLSAQRPTATLPRHTDGPDTVRMTLAELRLEDTGDFETVEEPPVPLRPYEREMGPITAQLLRELDETFAALVADKQRTSRWFQVMFDRRILRNQQRATTVDVAHLFREDLPPERRLKEVAAAMVARSLHASDPDAPTGLIPVMSASFNSPQEEDTA